LLLGRGAMAPTSSALSDTGNQKARDDTRLLAGFRNIQSQSVRKAVLALIESMAAS
jgi:hypothetical protein